MKYLTLFEEAYVNTTKVNLKFVKYDEGYMCRLTDKELQDFLILNDLTIDKFGHVQPPTPSERGPWGYATTAAPSSFNLGIFYS